MKTQKSSSNIQEILKYKLVNKLKSVQRLNHVDKRYESSAEHSWGTLILADYYLNKIELENKTLSKTKKIILNRLKVYELLMYHDLVEIYAGDSPLHPKNNDTKNKIAKEKKAAKQLLKELPLELAEKFYYSYKEFEDAITLEAKFCKAIDAFEAQIHEIDYKKDWKGWTKEFLINKKIKYFESFPEMKKDFLELCDYFEENGFFSQ